MLLLDRSVYPHDQDFQVGWGWLTTEGVEKVLGAGISFQLVQKQAW